MATKADLQRLAKAVQIVKTHQPTVSAANWDLSELCHEKQLEFINDPARIKVAICTRRAGKTMASLLWMIDVCLKERGITCLYLGLNRAQTKSAVWRDLTEILRTCQIPHQLNISELTCSFSNDSYIRLSGVNDEEQTYTFKGVPFKLVVIDEMQNHGSAYIEKLIYESIMPTLMDYNGTLVLSGTPSPKMSGFWYEAAIGAKNWPVYNWSFADNTFLLEKTNMTAEELLASQRKMMNMKEDGSEDTPTFKREFLGQWVSSDEERAYKWTDANDFQFETNGKTTIPETGTYNVVGIDTGYNHADSIAVITVHPSSRRMWLIHEWVRPREQYNRGLNPLFERIRFTCEQFAPSSVVMDPGVSGVRFIEDLRNQHGLTMVKSAQKENKEAYIHLLNEDLKVPRLFIQKETIAVEESWEILWRTKTQSSKAELVGVHSDIWDAILYAWREANAMMGYNTQFQKKVKQVDRYDEIFERALNPKQDKWWL